LAQTKRLVPVAFGNALFNGAEGKHFLVGRMVFFFYPLTFLRRQQALLGALHRLVILEKGLSDFTKVDTKGGIFEGDLKILNGRELWKTAVHN